MIKRAVIAPALLVTALALAGCSGSDEADGGGGGGAGDETTSGTPSPTETSTNTISPPLPKAPVLLDGEGAAQDLTFDVSQCDYDAGRQSVEGSIKNSSKKPADYLVIISWISTEGGNTLGRAITTLEDVKPGKSVDFKASGKIIAGADQCVPNVRRGTLKKG